MAPTRTLSLCILCAPFLLQAYPARALTFMKTVLDSTVAAPARPNAAAVADADGDADLDLVVGAPDYAGTTDRLLLYRQTGALAFTRATVDSAIDDPLGLAFDDVDDDGDNDIVLGTSSHLWLYSNGGSGSFTRSTIEASISPVRRVRVADLDGDGDEDLVALTNNALVWEENDGSESFTQHTIDGSPVTDNALALGDVDGDMDVDVVSVVYDILTGDGLSSRYTNDGSGTFTRYVFDRDQSFIGDLDLADIEGDGILDVVGCEFEASRVTWYPGVDYPLVLLIIGTNFIQNPLAVGASDLDSDGDQDVAVTGGNGAIGEVVYYENDGSESFTKAPIDGSAGNRPDLVVADMDANGFDDLVVTNTFPNQVLLYANPGPVGVPSPEMRSALRVDVSSPTRRSAAIRFALPRSCHVRLDIVSMTGGLVSVLRDGDSPAGSHGVAWAGRDRIGRPAAPGVYVCRLRTPFGVATRRFVLL